VVELARRWDVDMRDVDMRDVDMRDVDMQPKFIPVEFARQILPGTFEHSFHMLIDDELDLSPFSTALENDLTGAPAYHPGVLLEIVLFAYSRGIVRSRRIEAASLRRT
jgi:transposase